VFLGVVFNSFSFTKETHELKLGPVELSVKEKQAVDIPVWASVGAIVVGGLLPAFGNRKGQEQWRWRPRASRAAVVPRRLETDLRAHTTQ
jgi:hypothetical protein